MQYNYWSLRCSWSVACRRCSSYISILDLISGFNELDKDNCKTRRETFQFLDLVAHRLYVCVVVVGGWVVGGSGGWMGGDYCEATKRD